MLHIEGSILSKHLYGLPLRLFSQLVAFTCLYLLCTASFAGTVSPSGTLIIIVPSNKGLVVAADSRSTTRLGSCDDYLKILEPASPPRTIVTVTGHGRIVAQPGPEITNFCEYLESASPLLDLGKVVTSYLVETKAPDIFNLDLEDLGSRCLAAVKLFRTDWPSGLLPTDRELATIILAGYDPKNRIAIVHSFIVRINGALLEPAIERVVTRKFSIDDKRNAIAFGETDYLVSHVYGGIGRKFLKKETIDFTSQGKTIRHTTFQDAVAVATNLIAATSQATNIVPAPTGVGGPINIVLLGETPRAQKIKGVASTRKPINQLDKGNPPR